MDDASLALVGKALGHPARVRIIRLLAEQDRCMGGEIFDRLPLAQSTVSQHLAVLKDAGLIRATPRGTGMVYCVTTAPLEEYTRELTALLAGRPVCARTGD